MGKKLRKGRGQLKSEEQEPPPRDDGNNEAADQLQKRNDSDIKQAKLGWEPAAWALTISVVQLLVYTGSMFPSISGGDATELVFNACQLSVAHPPGYPLFTMLEWVFMHIPLGSFAYRANLAAVVFGALASGLIFLTVVEITGGDLPAGLLASVLFGSGKLVWFYSIQAEVFSLNNFFAALIFFLTCKCFNSTRGEEGEGRGEIKRSTVYLGSFACGLALTNQHTIVFYVVVCILSVYCKGFKTLFNLSSSANLLFWFLVGLSPYAYLVFAPGMGKPGSWGDTANVNGFLTHLLRREYGTFQLFSGLDAEKSRVMAGLRRYAANVMAEDFGSGFLFAFIGLVSCAHLYSKSKDAILCIFASYSFYTVTFHYLANLPFKSGLYEGVHARFWMQSQVALYILAGVGISYTFRLVSGSGRRARRGIDQQALLPFSMLLVALVFGAKFKSMDESQNDVIYKAFRDVLNTFPNGAKVIVKGDLFTNSLRYLQQCEGVRTDVELVDQAMLTYKWFIKVQRDNFPSFQWPGTHYHPFEETGFSMHQLMQANHRKHQPIFMLGGWNPQDPTPEQHYVHVPWGIADIVAPRANPFERWDGDIWAWYDETSKLSPNLDIFPGDRDRQFTNDRWEAIVVSDSYDVMQKNALQFLNFALANGDQLEALEKAEEMIASHISQGQALKSHHFRNLGVVRNRLMIHPEHNNLDMYNKTREAFKTYLRLADLNREDVLERHLIEQIVEG